MTGHYFDPCIIYDDIESLTKKIEGCANNPEKSSTAKIVQHIPCGESMSTIWAFDISEKYFVKNFCSSLIEHATNILNFENKKCYH